jgi:glutathione S-transferase
MGDQGHISRGHAPYGIVDTAAYQVMNPNSTVPLIKDGSFILWESNAIVTYLAMKYGAETLYQNDSQVLSRSIAWMAWTNEHLEPPLHTFVMELVRLAEELRSPDAVEPARTEIANWLKVLDKHLENQPYVCGDTFTLGDITTGAAVYRAHLFDACPPGLSNIIKWQKKLSKRNGFSHHVAPREFHLG